MTTRAKTAERGYGQAHKRERARWQARLNAGTIATCAQPGCAHPSDPITKATPWELGHNDDRTAWIGPVHVDCNRKDGQRKATLARITQDTWTPGVTSRDWLTT